MIKLVLLGGALLIFMVGCVFLYPVAIYKAWIKPWRTKVKADSEDRETFWSLTALLIPILWLVFGLVRYALT